MQCNAGTKITATVKAIKDSSASSKSKAKTLSKGKKVTGVIAYGDSKADWYKIKLTKSAKLNLYYLANTNGTNEKNGFKITFYNKDGKVFSGKNNGKKFLLFQKLPDYIRKMDGISVWQMVEQNLICRLVHTTSR